MTGSDAGGERAAIACSILGSCRLAGVVPRGYLVDVLPRLTGRIRLVDLPLPPSRWAAQPATQAAAALPLPGRPRSSAVRSRQ